MPNNTTLAAALAEGIEEAERQDALRSCLGDTESIVCGGIQAGGRDDSTRHGTDLMKAPRPVRLTILDLMDDPQVFGPWFQGPSWGAWRTFLKVLFGLPLRPAERTTYTTHTGRQHAPTAQATEAWLIVGRRGGKSLISALIAVYLACFKEYVGVLTAGERGTVMVIAADRQQARTVFRYIAGLLDGVPMLARLIEARTKDTITLTNRVSIEVHTASFRAVRGYTVIGAVLDEIAFWPCEESASPDSEIVRAIRPAMATVPGAMLVGISSPYARRGELWRAYRDHYGKDGDPVLVWQAETRAMNAAVPQAVIDAAYAEDEASASAEYGAQFRRDIESLLSREAIEACVVPGRRELPPLSTGRYCAFVDPAGGSGQDSMTLAIAHHEAHEIVLDAVREVPPPFSPEDTVHEFGTFLRTYRITVVRGDRYAGEWPREQFRKCGISYEVCEQSKSELYREVLPAINSRTLALLDHPRMITQFCGLERRVARGGRDSIDHAPNGHDDVCNAATGALLRAAQLARGTTELWMPEWNTRAARASGPDQCQLIAGFGSRMFEQPVTRTCATCQHFDAAAARCVTRKIGTQSALIACAIYEGRMTSRV